MASIPLTNGEEDVDFPDRIFTDSTPMPRRAFESRSDDLSPSAPHEELLGSITIYSIWMRKFAEDKDVAEKEWLNFRQDALNQYDALDSRLKVIENELNTREDSNDFLDVNTMLEKQANLEAISTSIDVCDENFNQVTQVFEQFSQYLLPKETFRVKVDSMASKIREKYFNLLQQRNRRREIFRWMIPRLQRYKSSGSEIKTWLDSAESRCEALSSTTKNIMKSEADIEEIVDELTQKKGLYEDFVGGGRGILSIHHELINVFNVHLCELERDVDDVTRRWDSLCLIMENYLHVIEKEKQELDMAKKTETEKIDIKIMDETHHCTCATPFKITKVGDGKYTFGTSKTVRLLRIHGQSIVVRVGGGWEYVYNFLKKVDPCRAKDFANGNINCVDGIHLNTGLTLTPLDDTDSSFTMSVQRLRKTSLTPARKKSGVLRSSLSIDALDSCDEVHDLLDLGRPSPASNSSAGRERKLGKGRHSIDVIPKSATSTPMNKLVNKKLSLTDSKLYKSTENLSGGRTGTRRLSLMDRQALYAQKRSSTLSQATSVLEF